MNDYSMDIPYVHNYSNVKRRKNSSIIIGYPKLDEQINRPQIRLKDFLRCNCRRRSNSSVVSFRCSKCIEMNRKRKVYERRRSDKELQQSLDQSLISASSRTEEIVRNLKESIEEKNKLIQKLWDEHNLLKYKIVQVNKTPNQSIHNKARSVILKDSKEKERERRIKSIRIRFHRSEKQNNSLKHKIESKHVFNVSKKWDNLKRTIESTQKALTYIEFFIKLLR